MHKYLEIADSQNQCCAIPFIVLCLTDNVCSIQFGVFFCFVYKHMHLLLIIILSQVSRVQSNAKECFSCNSFYIAYILLMPFHCNKFFFFAVNEFLRLLYQMCDQQSGFLFDESSVLIRGHMHFVLRKICQRSHSPYSINFAALKWADSCYRLCLYMYIRLYTRIYMYVYLSLFRNGVIFIHNIIILYNVY